MIIKRPKCTSCSRYLSSWGRTSTGKKRYGCRNCGKTRVYKKNVKKIDMFSLFKQYVLWGLTYQMLASLSGYSVPYLDADPLELPLVSQSDMEVAYLLIDGLWFGRWFVLLVYRQSQNLIILHISVGGRVDLGESHVRILGTEAFLINAHIPFFQGSDKDYDPQRSRKLLLHKSQINSLIGKISKGGVTLIPISLYEKNNRFKVEVGLAKSKKEFDKRKVIKERDNIRRVEQELRGKE